ncbi:MAG: RluA family pseudouridine synthase [Candidatus Omnitrophota bacterium]
MHILEVALEDSGKRVDNVSLKHLVGVKPELEISRTLVQDMIDKGEVLLNGKKVKPSHKVNTGDKIEIDLEKLEKESLAEHCKKIPRAEKLPLNIIYEDDDILVINKPAGMVVHPACGNYSGTLVNALLNYKGFLTDFNEPRTTNDDQRESRAKSRDERRIMRPGIVHRLDKDTSGVMLVAKRGSALRKLSGQLKNRTITKKYIAVVKGIIELEEGIIDLPVNHDKKNRMKMVIDRYEGKDAVTQFKVLSRNKEKNFTILEVTPKTGRTHQIRIHFTHIGHPILGDTLYNGPAVQGLSRQALHAKSISFIHPSKNIQVEFSAEIPADINQFLR